MNLLIVYWDGATPLSTFLEAENLRCRRNKQMRNKRGKEEIKMTETGQNC
jgi:hypothetical protein